MMIKHVTIIDPEFIKWDSFINEKEDCHGEDVIHTITVDFGDNYEADIKICGSEDGPYVDGVLFEDGHDISVSEVSDSLTGEYHFEDNLDNIEFIVTLKSQK